MWFRRAACIAVGLGIAGIAGCGGSAGSVPSSAVPSAVYSHIIVVIQENRSFDNVFGGAGISGADVATTGLNSQNAPVVLHAQSYNSWDPDHAHASLLKEWNNGLMNGFDQITFSSSITNPTKISDPTYAYAFLPPEQIHPYVQMATTYSLSDRMFSSGLAPSFPGHEFLVAGRGPADDPIASTNPPIAWGCPEPTVETVELFDGSKVYPCFTYPTIADLLDAKNVSWKYYTGQNPEPAGLEGFWDGAIASFAAIKSIYNTAEAKAKIVPRNSFFDDIAANRLPSVSWITPNGNASDHAQFDVSADGPYWVAEIYEAIAQNPAYYGNTAILVTWDDSGAWYDHVPPPAPLRPMAAPYSAYQGSTLGMRVPLIFIAANARPGVSHTVRSFGSIIGFIENNYSLGNLGAQDVGTDALADLYNPRPSATMLRSCARRCYRMRAGRTRSIISYVNPKRRPTTNKKPRRASRRRAHADRSQGRVVHRVARVQER
jgi:phospholipase C